VPASTRGKPARRNTGAKRPKRRPKQVGRRKTRSRPDTVLTAIRDDDLGDPRVGIRAPRPSKPAKPEPKPAVKPKKPDVVSLPSFSHKNDPNKPDPPNPPIHIQPDQNGVDQWVTDLAHGFKPQAFGNIRSDDLDRQVVLLTPSSSSSGGRATVYTLRQVLGSQNLPFTPAGYKMLLSMSNAAAMRYARKYGIRPSNPYQDKTMPIYVLGNYR